MENVENFTLQQLEGLSKTMRHDFRSLLDQTKANREKRDSRLQYLEGKIV
jgi:hypothetical protein